MQERFLPAALALASLWREVVLSHQDAPGRRTPALTRGSSCGHMWWVVNG